jgi:hypothetical protein
MILCSDPVYDFWKDSPRSMLPIYRELIAAGLRIWVFRYVEFLFTSWFAFNSKSLEVAKIADV